MLVRLIDVVLILLFGFISISTIERKSPVVLPESRTSAPTRPQQGEVASVTVLGRAGEGGAEDGSPVYLVGLARGAERRVAGRDALRAELASLAAREAGSGTAPAGERPPMRVNLRVDQDERVEAVYEAVEVVQEVGLPLRFVVRVKGEANE